MNDEATYICESCGEEIVVPVDPTQGSEQHYVEDCPVCCRPNMLHVSFSASGEPHIWCEFE